MKIEVTENSNEKDLKLSEFPLNFEYFGEKENDSDLRIFIRRDTLLKIDVYLSSDLNNELGGVLLGDVCINSEKKKFIIIDNFIIAKHSNSSLSRLTFTHESWDYINEVREQDYPDKKILGWFHSHPGHTVFLSSFDIFIQENFFNMIYMVAYVFDPTIKERGFFHWQEDKIVRSEGYYVSEYSEENEFNIKVPLNTNEDLLNMNDPKKSKKNIRLDFFKNIKSIVFLVLTLCLSLLIIYNIYDINQKALLEEEHLKELNEIRAENEKLSERLNNLMVQMELKAYDTITDPDMLNDPDYKNIKKNESLKGTENSKNTSIKKYTVKAGDTLEKISRKFYNNSSAMESIMKLNNLKSKNDIQLGMELELPDMSQ